MMWFLRHGVVGTASRQVLNVCKQIVYACQTMSGRPDMTGRIFTHLSQIVCKLPEVVRQDVFYLYKMCAQNAWTGPAIPAVVAGQNNLSFNFCSSHVVPLLCRAVLRLVATCTSRMSCTVPLSTNNTNKLKVPRIRTKFGARAFSCFRSYSLEFTACTLLCSQKYLLFQKTA